MNINWYPGHMRKTKTQIQEDLSLVDIVLEIVDARIPYSSKNPQLDTVIGNKPRLIILNKSDLADDKLLKVWQDYYKDLGIDSIKMNSTNKKNLYQVVEYLKKFQEEKLVKEGKLNRNNIRAMVVGIPNVGKSTFINGLSGKKGARVGNTPGITRGKQWIKTQYNIDLLDTPGVLWPKFEDDLVAEKLAITGAIKDNILDIETLVFRLISIFVELNIDDIYTRYNINKEVKDPVEIMDQIGKNRGCIIRGGEIDYSRVSNLVMTEYRKGILGYHTLEKPSDRI